MKRVMKKYKSDKSRRLDMHHEVEKLDIFIQDSEDSELAKNIGRRCVFINPLCHAEFDMFTICAIQKMYDGSLAYRVVGDKDEARFGRTARPNEIKFI